MKEKRKHKRVYFINEDYFIELEGKKCIKARLLSLSEGGISFFLPQDNKDWLKKDELVFLKSIENKDGVLIKNTVSLSIRYANLDDESKKLIVGCKFLDLNEDDRRKIKFLVNKKLKEFPI